MELRANPKNGSHEPREVAKPAMGQTKHKTSDHRTKVTSRDVNAAEPGGECEGTGDA